MNIAQIALLLSPVIAIPLRINPCRLQIILVSGIKDSNKMRLILTAIILSITGTTAIFFPDVYAALSILAGTVGCLINFTIPGKFNY